MGHAQIDAMREKKGHYASYNQTIKSQDVVV